MFPSSQLIQLNHKDYATIGGSLNRAVRVAPDSVIPTLIPDVALQQLDTVAEQLAEHDFIVFDDILTEAALQLLSDMLLQSTIWFDLTNGMAFVAHHDDGLPQSAFRDLATLLAAALSSPSRRFRVVKYYAVAMKVADGFEGPLAIGMYHVVQCNSFPCNGT